MNTTNDMQRKVFLLLLVGVTLAFFAILLPFYGAIFWSVALAVLFMPLHRRIAQRMPRWPALSALLTLLVCLVIVVLPITLLISMAVQESTLIYERIKNREIDFSLYMDQITAAAPQWLMDKVNAIGLDTLDDLKEKLASLITQGGQFLATHALNIGQNTFQFALGVCIMLYLLFFMIRDGASLGERIHEAVPLNNAHQFALIQKFVIVVRATIKGNIIVAIVQGALGGFILWALDVQGAVLWGVVMGFLSLIPAVGASLVWIPVAIYFAAIGAYGKAIVLTVFGVGVIGLADNVLRPLLVGKDTKMPDYLVLVSTLGGLSLFGLNGFVIGPLIAALFISVWDIFTSENIAARVIAETVATGETTAPADVQAAAAAQPPPSPSPPEETPQQDAPPPAGNSGQ